MCALMCVILATARSAAEVCAGATPGVVVSSTPPLVSPSAVDAIPSVVISCWCHPWGAGVVTGFGATPGVGIGSAGTSPGVVIGSGATPGVVISS
eukprot:gene8679-biopygen8537